MTGDVAHLRSLRATLEEMERPGLRFTNDQAIAGTQSDIKLIEDEWSDERLIAAYQATGGEVGDVEADAFLAEIKWRNLDL